jgi:predicted nucleic acid-binding protein
VIVVDTSVWIAAGRKPSGELASTLRALLDADEVALALPVRIELTASVASKDRTAFKRAMAALPVLVPSEHTWKLLERWVEPAANTGHRFGLTDLLIAALTQEIGGLVWSLDSDFERMAKLKLVVLYG